MSAELALRNADPIALGEVMHKSGMFPDTKNAAIAAVKIMAGMEYGLGPAAAMSGIDVIDNKPVPRAIVILARVKGSGRYTYRVKEWTNQAAELEFSEKVDGKWEVLSPTSRFTMDDAKRAGLAGRQVWQRYPRNMLLWRAGVNGARLHCPEVFGGMPILSAEEAADAADLPITIVGATPEPVPTPNLAAAPQWKPSKDALKALSAHYVQTGWWEHERPEGFDGEWPPPGHDEHSRLRMLLLSVGADSTGEIGPLLASLDECQFGKVRDKLTEAAVTGTFDATAEGEPEAKA